MADSFHVKIEVEEEALRQSDSACPPEVDALIVIIAVADISQAMAAVQYNSSQPTEGIMDHVTLYLSL